MQTIKIDSVAKWREGDGNKNGKAYHWISYNLTFPELTIFDQTGTQYKFTKAATFDFLAASLKPGDTIECEAELKPNDKYMNLNLHGIKKVGGGYPQPPIDSVEKAFTEPVKPFTPPAVVSPTVVRTTKDQEISEAVAIKAIVELACAKVIEPNDPYVRAAKNWIADKLSHYLAPNHTQLSVEANKPSVGGTGDASVDKRMLLGLVKTNMKFPDDKTAISWLVNVHKVPQTKIDTEAGKVYDEVRTKQGWE